MGCRGVVAANIGRDVAWWALAVLWACMHTPGSSQAPWPAGTTAAWYLNRLRKGCKYEESTHKFDLGNHESLFWRARAAIWSSAVWAVRESGSWAVGELGGGRGVGRSGSRRVGELGGWAVGESESRGCDRAYPARCLQEEG